ncbi:MAG: OsmC family protein [Gammaproteobacteria bacterium]|nr:OsmC family protein [Gammaproteobacteria bacterium]
MKVNIKWVDDVMFLGETGSGHAVVMDGPPEGGGRNIGARPMEMLLLGLGGCTAYDVMHILKKSRQSVTTCSVDIEAQRSDMVPKVFTDIHVHFNITGRGLKEEHIKRAITLSADKYCSASIMLGETAQITHDYTITEVDEVS